MGYMRHHAIIVTGPSIKAGALQNTMATMAIVRAKICKIAAKMDLEQLVSLPVDSITNGFSSFFIGSDGSKEGWEDSTKGDALRDAVIDYLNTLCYSDGSTSFRYVEVQYGDDEGETKILRSSDGYYKVRQLNG